jgi:hypothetical protein
MRPPVRVSVAALALTACLAGSVAAQPPPPYAPIPPPRVEVIPAPPGARFIWQPGHWHWDGATYVWVPGRYVQRFAHYHHWVPGAWVLGGHGWVWVPAHWV